MKPILLTFLTAVGFLVSFSLISQVSINENGTPPDASAGLDISSEDKGLLIPRMTEDQRNSINTPANSLLIYQLDGATGYYYNAGTPDIPDWQPLVSNATSECEKRIEITELPFVINSPGSYYLGSQLTGIAGQDGITINTSFVTVDLNGFTLVGAGSTTGEAITFPLDVGQIKIYNGHITNWADQGINAGKASYSEFSNLNISNNGGDGIIVDESCLLINITSKGNGSDGIDAHKNAVISHCTSSGNGSDGFDVGEGASLSFCSSDNNVNHGYRVSTGSNVMNCSAYNNQFSGFFAGNGCVIQACTSSDNLLSGFTLLSGNLITKSIARQNDKYGFEAGNDCHLLQNISDSNLDSGFFTSFSDSRFEDNQSTDNIGYGFEIIETTANLIIKNSASGNSLNGYLILAGNAAGPIISGAAVATNTNPNANINY